MQDATEEGDSNRSIRRLFGGNNGFDARTNTRLSLDVRCSYTTPLGKC